MNIREYKMKISSHRKKTHLQRIKSSGCELSPFVGPGSERFLGYGFKKELVCLLNVDM